MGKGQTAREEQFLFFPQCFQLSQVSISPFVHIFDIISLFAIELEEPKIGISGKGILCKSTFSRILVTNPPTMIVQAGTKHIVGNDACVLTWSVQWYHLL